MALVKLLSINRICRATGKSGTYVRALLATGLVDGFVTDTGHYAGTMQTVEQIMAHEAAKTEPADEPQKKRRPRVTGTRAAEATA